MNYNHVSLPKEANFHHLSFFLFFFFHVHVWGIEVLKLGVQKLSYNGGGYMNGHFSQVYPSQAMMGGNTLMPMYPYYHFHHQSQTMGLPAHMYSPAAAGPMNAVPALISKPTSIPPTAGINYSFGLNLYNLLLF